VTSSGFNWREVVEGLAGQARPVWWGDIGPDFVSSVTNARD
jgi:hypothetical protein